jgi:hypothetical protein
MLIQFTLGGLVILLIAVIALSYYANKEGFDNITVSSLQNKKAQPTNLSSAPVPSSSIPSPVSVPAPASSITPQRNVVVPEVSLSESGYNAMKLQQKKDLLKDIQKVVRNEILANRMTTPMMKEKENDKMFSDDDSEESDCTMQGKEYEASSQKNNGEDEYRCPKNPDGSCPPVPDMTKYIKKDAIPCWGCSIQY